MKFEPELIARLLQAKCLERVAEPKGFALELTTEKGVYMARLSKTQINDLCERAKAGDVEAMYVVSALYDLGIGLPEDSRAAANWANFSMLSGGNVSFDDACRKLESDIANSINVVRDGYVYPEKYLRIQERFKSFLSFGVYEQIDIPKGAHIRVAPFVSGVHVAACYKRVKGTNDYVLYDAWTLEDNRMLPFMSHFASRVLPMKLAEWLNGDKISHSNTVGIEGSHVFVYGTLAVRKDRVSTMRANIPDVKSVRALLDVYLNTPVRTNPFDERELATLRSAYVRSKKQYTKTGSGKAEYKAARAAYRKAKEEFEQQRDAWIAKQPESYLDFVAYDMVGYEKGDILHITDLRRRYLKLQTTAFIPPTTRECDVAGLPVIDNAATLRKHHREVFEHFQQVVPYKLLGLEVLQIDNSGMNADSRIVYRVKE